MLNSSPSSAGAEADTCSETQELCRLAELYTICPTELLHFAPHNPTTVWRLLAGTQSMLSIEPHLRHGHAAGQQLQQVAALKIQRKC